MSADKLREKFIRFFEKRGHKVISSASLVPENDPSVLFTTAGMQQFKRYYLFPDEAPTPRVATIQRCLRTGDIDEVGDESHLTFFEMLGNFSFGYPKKEGSYFKEEAIKLGWEFLTDKLGIDQERISATYYGEKGIALGPDNESKKILLKYLDNKKVREGERLDNFWSLGIEGSPGGRTVEFYVDGIEVWNLVFNEAVLKNSKYELIETKGVDTGMGLERLAAVKQGKSDIYETDLFALIIEKIEEISGKKYQENKKEFRIIADHLRGASALIADGVVPSNKDRGYILRRLIRRAIVKGRQIGVEKNFCADFSESEAIKSELDREETRFRENLAAGLKIILAQKEFSGKVLFDLYQTYGIPVEVAIEEAARLGHKISDQAMKQFNNESKVHQELSRTASAGMFKGGLADNKIETTRLHTAAHLLLAALRQVLSPEVNQKGSNITEERLRFDFNWPEKLTQEQLSEVENIVNEKIKENLPVEMEEMTLLEAKKSGATGVFDDRYGEKVKVYRIGSFSKEICGGPHVKNTGELGHFKITKEESSSAGIRRIKAVLE